MSLVFSPKCDHYYCRDSLSCVRHPLSVIAYSLRSDVTGLFLAALMD
jgi:hypothetical protein